MKTFANIPSSSPINSNNPLDFNNFEQSFSNGITPTNSFGPSTANNNMNSNNFFNYPTTQFPNNVHQEISNPQITFTPQFVPPPPKTTTTTTTTTRKPIYHQPTKPATINNNLNEVCGTRYSQTEVSPLVFGGVDTQRGDFPWMVAIYLNKPTGLSFNCGGSLVSSKSVITAAHCIHTSTKNYRAQEIILYLGRYSLVDWSETGSIATNVDQIIIHSDYKIHRDSFDADVAILIMSKRVEYNQYVRPVCLWEPDSSLQDVEGKRGTVVGWGKDGTDRVVSNIPKKVDLPIVNTITCIQTSESLSKVVSNRTFCAGTLNGDGPCHGDSGKFFEFYSI